MTCKSLRNSATLISISLASAIMSGCVGYNATLFVTKTNSGLDIDTTPPTAEITIGRRELVITPTLDSGETLPVMASFKRSDQGLFSTALGSTFSGGKASVRMSRIFDASIDDLLDQEIRSVAGGTTPLNPINEQIDKITPKHYVCANAGATVIPSGGKRGRALKPFVNGTTTPFIFGTDTSLGLKVGWSGMTAVYPSTLKLGFNRKELAISAMYGEPGTDSAGAAGNGCQTGKIKLEHASFLATVDASANFATAPGQTSLGWMQFFATGAAAESLTLRDTVRQALAVEPARQLANVLPNQVDASRVATDNRECLARHITDNIDGATALPIATDVNNQRYPAITDQNGEVISQAGLLGAPLAAGNAKDFLRNYILTSGDWTQSRSASWNALLDAACDLET